MTLSQVKLTVQFLQDEDLVLERDQICNAINDAFNTWDIPCTEHDSDDEEHDSIDDDHDVVDAENSTPDFFEDPNADAENDILVLDFGHDIVFAEELGTVSFSFKQIGQNKNRTQLLTTFRSQNLYLFKPWPSTKTPQSFIGLQIRRWVLKPKRSSSDDHQRSHLGHHSPSTLLYHLSSQDQAEDLHR